jgi:hypothetical protein
MQSRLKRMEMKRKEKKAVSTISKLGLNLVLNSILLNKSLLNSHL